MMKKIAIFICILLLSSVLLIPQAVANSDETGVYICPFEVKLVDVDQPDNVTFVGVQEVSFKNIGYTDACQVTATISQTPDNVVASDPEVAVGDIPAGCVVSGGDDTFTLVTDLSNPSGVEEGIFWTIEYYVAGNPNPQYLYMVPQSCDDCIPPVPTDPGPPPLAELQAVQYRFGDPCPGFSFARFPIFEGWLNVRIENTGAGDAFDVTATIIDCPANTTATDPDVTVGDIPAGCSAWSCDTFTTEVDLFNPSDPDEGITWQIEYNDAGGHHTIEVPEFP